MLDHLLVSGSCWPTIRLLRFRKELLYDESVAFASDVKFVGSCSGGGGIRTVGYLAIEACPLCPCPLPDARFWDGPKPDSW